MAIIWTDDLDDALREFAGMGMSSSKIAEKINARFNLPRGITKNSVVGRSHRVGIKLQYRPGGQPNPAPVEAKPKVEAKAKPKANTPTVKKEKKADRGEQPMKKVAILQTMFDEPLPYVGKRITDLGMFDCRWTDSSGHPGSFVFCAKRKQSGSSYCAEHHARVYVPPRPR